MPILLETPHSNDPGHGSTPVDYHCVIIDTMTMHAFARRLALGMVYFNIDPQTGAPLISPEPAFAITIENKPAVVDRAQRINPDTGVAEIEDVVLQAEDLAFDRMREEYVVEVIDGSLHASGFDYGVEVKGYDLTSDFLYVYLLENGPNGSVADGHEPYYRGTIV